jgi:hypothetical protein
MAAQVQPARPFSFSGSFAFRLAADDSSAVELSGLESKRGPQQRSPSNSRLAAAYQ